MLKNLYLKITLNKTYILYFIFLINSYFFFNNVTYIYYNKKSIKNIPTPINEKPISNSFIVIYKV